MEIGAALEVFVKGFSYTRSTHHPCEGVKIAEGVWIVRDSPPRKTDPRNSEITAYRRHPSDIIELAREHHVGRHSVCALMTGDAKEMTNETAEFKALGYRLMRREPLFVAETAKSPYYEGSVRRVVDQEVADQIAKLSGRKQILPEHLTDPNSPLRLFAAFEEDRPIGWVSSIRTDNGSNERCAWVASLYVSAHLRGKGHGRSLMSAMLADDSSRGIAHSVLLASSAGARLYPHVGYDQIGTLHIFSPPK